MAKLGRVKSRQLWRTGTGAKNLPTFCCGGQFLVQLQNNLILFPRFLLKCVLVRIVPVHDRGVKKPQLLDFAPQGNVIELLQRRKIIRCRRRKFGQALHGNF